MITLNMTAGDDNELIVLFRFYLSNGVSYLATKSITLGSQLYDGEVLLKQGVEILSESNNVLDGGGVGSVGNLSISIANKVDNVTFSDFFDSFYPNNSVYLINRSVEIGVVWVGATSESEITWLQTMLINNYQYQDSIELDLVSYTDNDNPVVPYYVVQEDYDNGISYFPKAPDESMGKPIPIIYGNYDIETSRSASSYVIPQSKPCTPIIPIDDSTSNYYKFIIASHNIYGYNYRPYVCYPDTTSVPSASTDPDITQYNSSFGTMSFVYNTTSTVGGGSNYTLSNNWYGSFYSILQPDKINNYIYADIYKKFDAKIMSGYSSATHIDYNLKHLFKDIGTTTEIELPAGNAMGFGFTEDSQQQSIQGRFDNDSGAYILAKIRNDSGADISAEFLSSQNGSSLVKTSTLTIPNGVSVAYFNAYASTSEGYAEFTDRIFEIENKDASNSLYIEQVYLVFSKILIDGFGFHYIQVGGTRSAPQLSFTIERH